MNRDEILKLTTAQDAYVLATRRHFHQNPELSFRETETSKFVASELRALGMDVRDGIGSGGTGVVATMTGGKPGPTLALRADMDALPVQEANDLPFRSQNAGVMHACGHDAHTAMLLGAARALASIREQVPGKVVFLFQHAEELPPGGALELIEAGCMDGVDAVFGLHQATALDAGQIGIPPGPRTAASDSFKITVTGRGGHGAMPHHTVDPVQVGAALVTALHQIVSRRIDPMEPGVITIGSFHSGTKNNVIADTAEIEGTVRSLNERVRQRLHRELQAVADGVTKAWGATYEMEYIWGYPVLTNEPVMSEVGARAAEVFLDRAPVVRSGTAQMGGEDFAHYLSHAPGAFAWLGAGTAEIARRDRGNAHAASFMMDEAALPAGVAWFISLVMNFSELRQQVASP